MFLLAMVLYPDIQRRAQAEIDEVVGRDHAPTFGDRARMPYLEALVREVLRWRPVGPMGLPRKTSEVRWTICITTDSLTTAAQDDWYNEYFIPKGMSCRWV